MTCCSWSMNFFEGSKDISEGVAMRSKILIVIIFDVLIRVFCVGSTCDWICHVHLRVCSMIFVTFIFICSRTMSYFSLEPLSIRERGVIDCRWTSIYIATISRWRYGYDMKVNISWSCTSTRDEWYIYHTNCTLGSEYPHECMLEDHGLTGYIMFCNCCQ